MSEGLNANFIQSDFNQTPFTQLKLFTKICVHGQSKCVKDETTALEYLQLMGREFVNPPTPLMAYFSILNLICYDYIKT